MCNDDSEGPRNNSRCEPAVTLGMSGSRNSSDVLSLGGTERRALYLLLHGLLITGQSFSQPLPHDYPAMYALQVSPPGEPSPSTRVVSVVFLSFFLPLILNFCLPFMYLDMSRCLFFFLNS